MKHKLIRLILCFVLLLTAACAPLPTPAPAPTDTPLSPTATSVPPTPTPTPVPPDVIAEIDTMLGNLAEKKLFVGSVLIASQGEVLLSEGYGMADRMQNIPNTPQTRFRLADLTKQFTAMAILILASQGKLTVQDPICMYVTDCPAAWEAITIHHLLTHTSGLHDFLTMINYRSLRATSSTPEQTMARFKDLPLDFPPGETHSYSNSGYIVLGYIIEQVSGLSYEDFLKQFIFEPLDLQNTGYDHNSNGLAVGYASRYTDRPADFIDMSIPYAAGALYSTTEDLYTWDQALYTEKLVPRAYLDEMFAPHVFIPGSERWGGWYYGYGWSVGFDERGLAVTDHWGGIEGFSTNITRYPNERTTLIMLSNQQVPIDTLRDILTKRIFGDK